MNYDLLILAAEKDYKKVPICIEQCRKHLSPQPVGTYIVTPTTLPNQPLNTTSYLDSYVTNIKKEDINYKNPGWIFKQLINLFQNVTPSPFYLSVDADLFFLNDIHLFENYKPKFFISNNQDRHAPYFILMNKIYGFERFCSKSFICDFMMFNRSLRKDFFGDDPHKFLELINPHLSDGSLLADYEWYANFVFNQYPHMYLMQNVKSKTTGYFDGYDNKFGDTPPYDDIRELFPIYKKEYDMMTNHAWTDTSTLEDQTK